MFTKLTDNTHHDIRSQFLQVFGNECYEKILAIERKLNSKIEEYESRYFEGTMIKVKVLMDSYQIIAYQIYGSCEAALLQGLGKSVLKMFEQISIAIKWLIKILIERDKKQEDINKEQIIQIKNNQNQKFRNLQINKFIVKGFMQQLEQEEKKGNDGCWEDQIKSVLGNNYKFNLQKSKRRLLQINPSNVQQILLQTMSEFTKKYEYLQKYTKLRQNYGQYYRIEQQPLTSKQILQGTNEIKKKFIFQKLKSIYDRFYGKLDKKKLQTIQIGIQIQLQDIQSQKLKRQDKRRIKQLTQQLQKQKNITKIYKQQLQMLKKKYEQIKKQNNTLSNTKKKIIQTYKLQLTKFQNRIKRKQSKSKQLYQRKISNNINNQLQIKCQIVSQGDINIKPIIKQQQIDTTKNQRKDKIKNRRHNSIRSLKNIYSKINILNQNHSHQINKPQQLHLTLIQQIYDLEIFATNQNITERQEELCQDGKFIKEMAWKQECTQLKIQSCVWKLHISEFHAQKPVPEGSILHITNIKNIDSIDKNIVQKINIKNYLRNSKLQLFTKQQNTDQTNNMDNIPINQKNQISHEQLQKNCKLSYIKNKIGTNYTHGNQKKQQNYSGNHSKENKLYSYSNNFGKGQGGFQSLFKYSQIKILTINSNTLCQFFINQDNAKNYELLTISQSFSSQKRSNPAYRRLKASTDFSSITSKSKTKQYQNSSNIENDSHWILSPLSKKLPTQLHKIKQSNRQIYLKTLLFIKFPYSVCYRYGQIIKKINQKQQIVNTIDIYSRIKRIWTMHTKCNLQSQGSLSIKSQKLCSHKLFILEFFGWKYVGQNDQFIKML